MFVLREIFEGAAVKTTELGNGYTYVSKLSDPDRFTELIINVKNSKNAIGVIQGELLGDEKVLLTADKTYVLAALDKNGKDVESVELK
jgi:hypothetical protein